MVSFLGYNFCQDGNCLDALPTYVDDITYTEVKNGEFNHLNMDTNLENKTKEDINCGWDFSTILNVNFSNNIIGGNLDAVLSEITCLRVKRRKLGDFDWVFLFDVEVNDFSDLIFKSIDTLNQNGVSYQYTIIPMINNIEGNYAINSVESSFDGVFLCDKETIFKFYANMSYGETEVVQRTNIFEPIGANYPIVVSNSDTQYRKGSFSGKLASDNFLDTRVFDRLEEVEFSKNVSDFLINKKAKVLKDWNGNIWLISIIDSPKLTYDSSIGMGLMDISASWAEIGDVNSSNDLISCGITEYAENKDGD